MRGRLFKSAAVVARREFNSYFTTSLGELFLGTFILLTGFFTFKVGGFYELGQADLRSFFVWHPWVYMVLIPAVSMRLWAEERGRGTIELLLTLPITLVAANLGKFFAAWMFIVMALALTFPIIITVGYLGSPDYGAIAAGYLGSWLMAGAFLAVCICVSAACTSQVTSFICSALVCLIFNLLGSPPMAKWLRELGSFGEEIQYWGVAKHFESVYRGVIEATDLVYFGSMIALGLIAAVLIIDRKRAD
jgi:ABC-2 type transport system permease protein